MADTYRITPQGPEFMVSQNAGVTVGVYNTEQEAQVTMEDCKRDDFMLQTARNLVNAAVEAHMRLHHVDRRAAHGWIREASD
jgi:NAD dependent epimerase/dehydratase family enzyme